MTRLGGVVLCAVIVLAACGTAPATLEEYVEHVCTTADDVGLPDHDEPGVWFPWAYQHLSAIEPPPGLKEYHQTQLDFLGAAVQFLSDSPEQSFEEWAWEYRQLSMRADYIDAARALPDTIKAAFPQESRGIPSC